MVKNRNKNKSVEFDEVFEVVAEVAEVAVELICVDYGDGVYRWVEEAEAILLDKQDQEALTFLFKIPKGITLFYFSTLYLPFCILTTNANAVVKENNFSSSCIEKVDSPSRYRFGSCDEVTDQDQVTKNSIINESYDNRPSSLRNKKKGRKSLNFKGVGRILGSGAFVDFAERPSSTSYSYSSSSSSSSSTSTSTSTSTLNPKPKGVGRVLGSGAFVDFAKRPSSTTTIRPTKDPTKDISFSLLFGRPSYLNPYLNPKINKININKDLKINLNVTQNKSSKISFQKGNYLDNKFKETLQARNISRSTLIENAREVLKESNKKVISRELEQAKQHLLKMRGGLTIPGLGIPFGKQILTWGIKNAQTILMKEGEKVESEKTSKKNLLKLFDITNPIILVGLTIIGVTLFRGGKGGDKTKKKLIELIENIQESAGLKKRKNVTNILSDSVFAFFSFYKKRPLLFILTIIVIWKRKFMYDMITNSSERGDITSLAFNMIKRQTDLLVEAKEKTVVITSEWMNKFYRQVKALSDQDAKRMVKMETEIEKLREAALKQNAEIHSHQLINQRTTFNLHQCDEDHQRIHENNQVLYEYYKNLKQTSQEFFKAVGSGSGSGSGSSNDSVIQNSPQQISLRKAEELALKKVEAQITREGAELLVAGDRKTYAPVNAGVTINVNLKEKKN